MKQNKDREDLEIEFLKYCSDFIIKISYTDERYLLRFIETYTQKKVEEALNNILEENHCDLDGTYDYDGIAETVIKLCKNK